MIIDKIENYNLYDNLSDRIKKAFEYIKTTDLENTPSGKYEIDCDNIFALIQDYETKNPDTAKPESHFKYIDIQYIIDGNEQIGVALLNNQTPVEKNLENDYAFYDTESTLVPMHKGMFAVFFPEDLHMPGIQLNGKSTVKKLVVKIRI